MNHEESSQPGEKVVALRSTLEVTHESIPENKYTVCIRICVRLKEGSAPGPYGAI